MIDKEAKITYYKEAIMEKVAEKKEDPYKMTKFVGITNLLGVPGDMAYDAIVEALDFYKHEGKAKYGKGIKSIKKALYSPEFKQKMRRFMKKQKGAALPMSVGTAALFTVPAFVSDYKKHNGNNKRG